MKKYPEGIPTTIKNLQILVSHLRYVNWGGWELPKMTIGYSAAEYDCDGKTAVTIKLDRPIDDFADEDEKNCYAGVTKFQRGAPHGHLMKYHRI